MNYDFIIIGAGAAGLYAGVELLKRKPASRILILEQYDYVGGRVLTHRETYRGTKIQWEDGAGRISEKNTHVRNLIKRYDLHTYPIGNGSTNWYSEPNPFFNLIPTYLHPLQTLPTTLLQQSTLGEILTQIHGPEKTKAFTIHFPYWAEMYLMRGDIALNTFCNEFGGKEEFMVVAEGFQAITDGLAKEFKSRGGLIQLKTPVRDIQESATGVKVLVKEGEVEGDRIILALPSEALRKLPSIKPKMPILKHLSGAPFVRVYAVFPVHKGHSWFSDLPSTVVANRLRYIIPINSAKGVVMISYSDGPSAHHWMRVLKEKGLGQVKREIMGLVRKTFPERTIPEPHIFKMYPWSSGCTYWLPGSYSPERVCDKALQVTDRIYACGESLAVRQGWVESALESASNMLAKIK